MELNSNILNICIDRGNTRTKIGLFDCDNLIEKVVVDNLEQVFEFLENHKFCNVIYSSVRGDETVLQKDIENISNKFVVLSHKTCLPIINAYRTPQTLGKDRLAAVVGAWSLKPYNNSLVIDLGTAATFDFVSDSGYYMGGAISPGFNMRLKSLNYFTDKLPLVKPKKISGILGSDTFDALRFGAYNSILFEIEGYIRGLEKKYSPLFVFLTGGDAFFFENKLKSSIFANENLVLIGLNRILNYNVE